MNRARLVDMLKKHEGVRDKPYKDSEGILTIGVGRNLEKGLSKDEVDYLLGNDLDEAINAARVYWWFDGLNDVRREIIVNMIFNLGPSRFAGFKKTIAAIQEQNWPLAAKEMLDSKWAKQVGRRAIELAEAMKTGEFK